MDRSEATAWETRFDWTLTALMFGAFGLAIFLGGLDAQENSRHVGAAIISGAYVIVLQATPRRIREQRLVGELLATAGVAATLLSVALTDATNSGYVLLVSVPIFFAAAFMGFRIGMETALMATVGLMIILIVLDLSIAERATTLAFYLLIGFTFSQARRLLVIERARYDALRAAGALDAARVDRLESAHALLMELVDLAGTAELSAVNVGESALSDLSKTVPMAYGAVTSTTLGEIVAEWGTLTPTCTVTEFPVAIGDRTLGSLRIWHENAVSLDEHRTLIDATTAGVALAFENIQLLQMVARRSIQDERNRVARELHDDIGPALASLGLSMDVLVTTATTTATERQLRRLRGAVTELVEKVRATVAALRRADTTTVVEHIQRIAAELRPGSPRIMVDVEELRAADGATAAEVGAIVIEAARNAAMHAEATTVTINGVVDGERGLISVRDDGKGFDATADFPGHFGLVGMRERAAAIEGELSIQSDRGRGTTLTVVWGDQPPKAPS
jgi:signal transduction histidine kinase